MTEKETIIDLRGAMLIIERETKEKLTATMIIEQTGIGENSPRKWDKKAPSAVKLIKHLLDTYPFLTFNDLVKNV